MSDNKKDFFDEYDSLFADFEGGLFSNDAPPQKPQKPADRQEPEQQADPESKKATAPSKKSPKSKKAKSANDKIDNSKPRRIAYVVASLLFVFTLAAGAGVSMALFERPTFSESEKRKLAEFPSLSVTTLFDGSFFSGINLWFSDTFPFRDELTAASSKIKSAIGIGSSVYNFTENAGDNIPDADGIDQDFVDISVETASDGPQDIQTALPEGSDTPISGGQTAGLEQSLNSLYVSGNTAYEYYNFVKGTADRYIEALNSASESLKGSNITLYSMLIPTSIDITLNEESRSKLNSSDQKDAINYIYSGLNGDIKKVMLFDLLKAHKDEYLYFRTDHHWTALGAYYSYAQLMSVKGVKYEPLSNFNQYKFDNFLGSFYSDTNKNAALGATPDTVYAFEPKCNFTFKMKQQGETEFMDYPLIYNATNFSQSYKYLCFIGGDQPISVIENLDKPDGEKCILVKESFGNCFAPFLTCNYKTVYIIDYRYFNGDITDFAKQQGVNDIIIASNMSMTRNSSLVTALNERL